MDPYETLTAIRAEVRKLLETDMSTDDLVDVSYSLAESFSDLDAWLRRGGFSPWDAGKPEQDETQTS